MKTIVDGNGETWFENADGTFRHQHADPGYLDAWTPEAIQRVQGIRSSSAPIVTRTKKRTNHTFHLIMTLCTFGAWGLMVWPWVALWNASGINKTKEETWITA